MGPKLGVPFWGASLRRTIAFWGSILASLYLRTLQYVSVISVIRALTAFVPRDESPLAH